MFRIGMVYMGLGGVSRCNPIHAEMKKLIINNLNKIHGRTVIIGVIDWDITLTTETESGDGYNLLLVTGPFDDLDVSTIWVSNEMSMGYVKMIRRWGSNEWVAYERPEKMSSSEEFIRMLGNAYWKVQ
jgi:hypothetical protein